MFKLMTVVLICLMSASNANAETHVKAPNVAGQFYPNDPQILRENINTYLSQADVPVMEDFADIIIVPHAGHVYSGPVAAHAFKAVSQQPYQTIVILAPTHHARFDGISIWPQGAFQTLLGKVEVDEEFSRKLMQKNEKIQVIPEVFDKEHSLEVELPFIQVLFPEAKIVPMINARSFQPSDVDMLVNALDEVISQREDVLIVISTDQSHFHDASKAKALDYAGIDAIRMLDGNEILKNNGETMEIDGVFPVLTAIRYAQKRGLNGVDLLRYGHSGEVSGDNNRVVGYAAMVFHKGASAEKPSPTTGKLNETQQKRLLTIARETLEAYVKDGNLPEFQISDPRLLEREGAFVTLHKNKQLRGCIGNIIGRGPLAKTVRDMAVAAAAHDSRFKAVSEDELKDIDVEVSVLSKPEKITSADEIILGKHGVIISRGNKNGVFLPQVADETGWSKEEFLGQLCSQKAGLPADCWKDGSTRIEVFTAQVFDEHDIH